MSDNRDRISLAPLRSTAWGKLALAGSRPLPAGFEAVADLVSERRRGAVLRNTHTGAYVLWAGDGALQSLPAHKIDAALKALA